jgi:hypothetical protein
MLQHQNPPSNQLTKHEANDNPTRALLQRRSLRVIGIADLMYECLQIIILLGDRRKDFSLQSFHILPVVPIF